MHPTQLEYILKANVIDRQSQIHILLAYKYREKQQTSKAMMNIIIWLHIYIDINVRLAEKSTLSAYECWFKNIYTKVLMVLDNTPTHQLH